MREPSLPGHHDDGLVEQARQGKQDRTRELPIRRREKEGRAQRYLWVVLSVELPNSHSRALLGHPEKIRRGYHVR